LIKKKKKRKKEKKKKTCLMLKFTMVAFLLRKRYICKMCKQNPAWTLRERNLNTGKAVAALHCVRSL
jgi:hypothetical protein